MSTTHISAEFVVKNWYKSVVEATLFHYLTLAMFLAAGATFVLSGTIVAPYGRYATDTWGPVVSARVGWMVMESPALWWFVLVFTMGGRADHGLPRVFATLWLVHYIHRDLIFPAQMRTKGKTMPVFIVMSAFAFNLLNGYINARSLSEFGPEYTLSWCLSFRFLYGLALFIAGFVINRVSDYALLRLRSPEETGYKIPRGGLFEEVSCPNYLGEIIQWFGWALMTWSAAGFAFAVFSAANLIPRAVAHHQWYLRTFPDYPRRRRAIIPMLL